MRKQIRKFYLTMMVRPELVFLICALLVLAFLYYFMVQGLHLSYLPMINAATVGFVAILLVMMLPLTYFLTKEFDKKLREEEADKHD